MSLASDNFRRRWSTLRKFSGHCSLRKLQMIRRDFTGLRSCSCNCSAIPTWALGTRPSYCLTCCMMVSTGNCLRHLDRLFDALASISSLIVSCISILSSQNRRYFWAWAHHHPLQETIITCWRGTRSSQETLSMRTTSCSKFKSILASSGNVASMTGALFRLARMVNYSHLKLLADLTQFSRAFTHTMMIITKRTKSKKWVALHRVDLLYMLAACEIIRSTRCRLTTKMQELTRIRINSSKEEHSSMLRTVFRIMQNREYPLSILWARLKEIIIHIRRNTVSMSSIEEMMPRLWQPSTEVNQIICLVANRVWWVSCKQPRKIGSRLLLTRSPVSVQVAIIGNIRICFLTIWMRMADDTFATEPMVKLRSSKTRQCSIIGSSRRGTCLSKK